MTKAKIPAPLLRKSEAAIEVAQLMLGDTASTQDIEDQSVSLLFMPTAHLAQTHKRMAAAVRTRLRQARKKR
jgi:hypothetical protein